MGHKEGELLSHLQEHGFVAMRAPASGSATTDDLPDVLAGDGQVLLAIEAKYRNKTDYCAVDSEEIAALKRFSTGFHVTCVPLLMLRWGYDKTWYVHELDTHEPGENYNTNRKLRESYPSFPEWFNEVAA